MEGWSDIVRGVTRNPMRRNNCTLREFPEMCKGRKGTKDWCGRWFDAEAEREGWYVGS